MSDTFVDRQTELATLRGWLESIGAALAVIYGRRRVGKTRLLREAARVLGGSFFVADLGSETEQLRMATERLFLATSDPLLTTSLANWESIFRYAMTRDLIFVLDEFPYLCASNPALPSILSRIWDEHHGTSRAKLLLSGSSIGFMEGEILGGKSPLYGRRTGQIRVEPMSVWDASGFFAGQDAQEIFSAYGVLGGMPAYLRLFGHGGLEEVLRTQALSRTGFLYDEARFMLMQELREPRLYLAVLRAIAGGRTSYNEIAQAVGLESRALASYLQSLGELGLLEREVPVTETMPHKSRKGRYRITDNFFRFAMRFIEPNRTELEAGRQAHVLARVQAELDDFIARAFEDACLDWVRAGGLDFTGRVGRWWSSVGEVDVCGLGDGRVLLGECKWSRRKVGSDILRELERKARWFEGQPTFALFSRAGFTAEVLREAKKRNDLKLVTVEDVVFGPSR